MDEIVRVEETPNYPHDNSTSAPEKSYALVNLIFSFFFLIVIIPSFSGWSLGCEHCD